MKEFTKIGEVVNGVIVDKQSIENLKNMDCIIPVFIMDKLKNNPTHTHFYFENPVEIEYFRGIDWIIDYEDMKQITIEDLEKVITAYCMQEELLEKIQNGSIVTEIHQKIDNMQKGFQTNKDIEKCEIDWNRIKLEIKAINKALNGSFETLGKKEEELDNLLQNPNDISIPNMDKIIRELKTEINLVVNSQKDMMTSYQLGMNIRGLNYKIEDLKKVLERKITESKNSNILFFPDQKEQDTYNTPRTM